MSFSTAFRPSLGRSCRCSFGTVMPPGGETPVPTLDIKVHVGTSTSPTSNGTKAVTGVGFQPKCLLNIDVGTNVDGAAAALVLGFGAATSTTARAATGIFSQNGVATTDANRMHDNSNCISSLNGGLIADLDSFDSDGFTLDFSTTNAVARIINHVCLAGEDLEVSLTQHQMNSDHADESFAHGLSGPPTAILAYHIYSAISPPDTSQDAIVGLGAWSSSGQFSTAIVSQDALSTSKTRRFLATDAIASLVYPVGGQLQRVMTVDSVDATDINVSYPTTVSSGQIYTFILAFRGCKSHAGIFNCNGSTDPLSISTPGCTPKLFLPVFVPTGVSNDGSVQDASHLTIGASDGTNAVSCGVSDVNNAATTNARRHQASTTLQERAASSGSLVFEATAAFSGETVVLTPTTNTNAAFGQGGYLVIGI